jgi:integrase
MAIEWFEERPSGQIIDDLEKWRKQVDALYNPLHKVFYELILFTGLRRTEALSLEWKNIHEDHIHLPLTKNGRSFDLPITQQHHELLAPIKRVSRKWVFPSRRSSSGYIGQPEAIDWSPHAHRRTFATVAMEVGVLEEIVGRLLNHTPISITGQRYARPSLDALRPSMVKVCDEMQRRTC